MVQDNPAIVQPDVSEDVSFDEPNNDSINTDLNETQDVAINDIPIVEEPAVNDMDGMGDLATDPNSTDLDAGFDDPVIAENPPTEPNFDEGFNDPAPSAQDGIGGIPGSLNTNNAGGSDKLYFGMDQKMLETVGMGVLGLFLIVAILLIARRRRMYAQATQVQEFDFTGSTQIDEQTKTHIDI